jgi:hypothetical protein
MDLHRRRSVLVRMSMDGRKLETVRIMNSPAAGPIAEPTRVISTALIGPARCHIMPADARRAS